MVKIWAVKFRMVSKSNPRGLLWQEKMDLYKEKSNNFCRESGRKIYFHPLDEMINGNEIYLCPPIAVERGPTKWILTPQKGNSGDGILCLS